MSKLKIDTDVWIDYIEKELDPAMSEDLARVLKTHPDTKEEFEKLSRVRGLIHEIPEEAETHLENEVFMQDLHSRIMSSVGRAEMKPKIWLQITRPENLRSAAVFALVVVGAFIIKTVLPLHRGAMNRDTARSAMLNDLMVETTVAHPQTLQDSMLLHEDEIDLFMDVTAQKMKAQSEHENDRLLKTLRE